MWIFVAALLMLSFILLSADMSRSQSSIPSPSGFEKNARGPKIMGIRF
jgi:hypothetical protein